MRELKIAENDILRDDGSRLTVRYCILAEDLRREDGQVVCEGYGVKLSTNRGDENSARTITTSLRRIRRVIEGLHRNFVLPMELNYVLEDLVL